MLYVRIAEIIRQKPTARRGVWNGALYAPYAQGLIEERDRKAKEKWSKQAARVERIARNKGKRELHELGVLHRRLERLRVISLKQVDFDDIGASHLTILIPGPENEALIEQEDQKDLVPKGFVAGDPEKWFVDTWGEAVDPFVERSKRWLQDDFVALEEEDSSSGESFMSFMSIGSIIV